MTKEEKEIVEEQGFLVKNTRIDGNTVTFDVILKLPMYYISMDIDLEKIDEQS